MKFKDYLKETESSDISGFTPKLDLVKNKHLKKGKKCVKHKRLNCIECKELAESKGL